MSTSKYIDQICAGALIGVLLLTCFFMNAGKMGVQAVSAVAGYESRLFNTSVVHTIDIVMDDWDSFLENCVNEEYVICTAVIDGDVYKNIAIRAKGNTSLSQVESYGNDRYSFKIEFDHYDDANTYYGLDKLCLNNIIQDNTYMKDYLTYQLMRSYGVDAPLCSYAYITVNGKDWGLYLAVEGVEESFLQRNYGSDYGELYKPDSTAMGGGRGNGREFDMDKLNNQKENFSDNATEPVPDDFRREMSEDFDEQMPGNVNGQKLEGFGGEMPEGFNEQMPKDADGQMPERFAGQMPEGSDGQMAGDFNGQMQGAFHGDKQGGGMMADSAVSLIYTDDEYESYVNIFENAKTDISDNDKERLIDSLKKLNANEEIDKTVNVEEVIRYFVVHNFVLNFDSYTGNLIHNYYLYEKDGELSMIPWDYNLAFGGFMSESDATTLINYPIDTPVSGGAIDSRPMLAWIFDNEEYTELYHQYFAEFIVEYFDSGYFTEMIDSLESMIAPYVEKDVTKFCTYDEFKEGVSTLKEFCLLRAQSISAQLSGIVPSTSEGQLQDMSSLVDGSDIAVSAMGSMGDMRGGHGDGTGTVPFSQAPSDHKAYERD